MSHPTITEVADELKECIKSMRADGPGSGGIQVNPHTLVWAEYWLRWATENSKDVKTAILTGKIAKCSTGG